MQVGYWPLVSVAVQVGYEIVVENALGAGTGFPEVTLHVPVEELKVAVPEADQLTNPSGTGIEFERPELHMRYIVAEKVRLSCVSALGKAMLGES